MYCHIQINKKHRLTLKKELTKYLLYNRQDRTSLTTGKSKASVVIQNNCRKQPAFRQSGELICPLAQDQHPFETVGEI